MEKIKISLFSLSFLLITSFSCFLYSVFVFSYSLLFLSERERKKRREGWKERRSFHSSLFLSLLLPFSLFFLPLISLLSPVDPKGMIPASCPSFFLLSPLTWKGRQGERKWKKKEREEKRKWKREKEKKKESERRRKRRSNYFRRKVTEVQKERSWNRYCQEQSDCDHSSFSFLSSFFILSFPISFAFHSYFLIRSKLLPRNRHSLSRLLTSSPSISLFFFSFSPQLFLEWNDHQEKKHRERKENRKKEKKKFIIQNR